MQGVGFRWFVEREASALGLAGWVRNREDSTVELVAVGEEEKLAQLCERLKQGPRASRVDAVDGGSTGCDVHEIRIARTGCKRAFDMPPPRLERRRRVALAPAPEGCNRWGQGRKPRL